MMPVALLGPNQHIAAPFRAPRTRVANVYVEANDAVTLYVTTESGVRAFREGRAVSPVYAVARDVTEFDERVDIPARTRGFLLIINFDTGEGIDHGRAVTYWVAQGK
jgi:hypothetical protein